MALSGPASCIATVDWKATSWDADKRRVKQVLKGMQRFPQLESGEYSPVVTMADGKSLRAVNIIRAWRPSLAD